MTRYVCSRNICQWYTNAIGARFAVFVRRARVLPGPCPATRNLSFWRCSPAPSPCCFNSLFHWTGTGWCENSTRWKSCKRGQPRGRGAWACLAHGLQCLCDGRACCPPRALQLVICRSGGVHRRRHPVVSTRCFTGLVRVGVKIPQHGNRANTYVHVYVVRGHVWRTVYSVCATSARVARPVPCNS
jgi:hypothetical protein